MSRPYTEEEKRAILAIVDGCEVLVRMHGSRWRFAVYGLISELTDRHIQRDSWNYNIKRWRAELEPVPFVPVEPTHEHNLQYSHTSCDADGSDVAHWYVCDCGHRKEEKS